MNPERKKNLRKPSKTRVKGHDILHTTSARTDTTERKPRKEALRSSEKRYMELAESIGDIFFAMDRDLRYTYWNKASENLTGISAKNALGKSIFDVFPDTQDTGRTVATFREVLKTRQDKSFINEYRLGDKNFVFEISVYPAEDGISIFTKDITERKQMEERLKESEEQYRGLFENSKDAVTINTPEGKFIDFNQSFLNLLGYSRSELRGMNVAEVYADAADRDEFRKEIERNGFVKNFEVKIRRKDGTLRDCLVASTAWQDKKGHIIGYQGILRDVTELKQMEDALRKSKEFSESLMASMRDGFSVLNSHGVHIDVNSALCKMTGFSREELIGTGPPHPYWPEEEYGNIETAFQKTLRGRFEDFELVFKRKNGERFPVIVSPSQVDDEKGNVISYFATVKDITERQHAEDELRRSEERFRKIFHSSPIPYLISSREGPILDANEAWVRMTGFSRREAIGHSTIELGMAQDPGQRGQMVKDLLEKGRLSNVELTRRTKSGELRDVIDTIELVELDGEKCILNMQVDITERKRMETELKRHTQHIEELVETRTGQLKESEEKFRRIYNASLDAIYTTSIDGEILDMNPAGVAMFGFDSLDELKKVNIESRYVNLEDRKRLIELAGKGPVRGFEVQFRRKDGERIDAIINCHPLKDEQGRITALQGAIIDITERRHMERLRDEFVADVTDELLTPLVSMKGYVDYVLKEKEGSLPEDTVSSLQAVKRNTDRLLDLINALVDIRRMESGKLQLNLEPLNLRELVEQCVRETQPLTAKKQSLRVELPEGPLPIRGDPARLSQVLMNLLSNAVKFSPEGEITLRVKATENAIEVQVSDTGIGIKKEDLLRIFEPFAAIQKPSYVKGTGLGLSITKGLVEVHGGRIWAESEGEGKGATFSFTIPKRKEEV